MFSHLHRQCFDVNASAADVKKCVREGHHALVLMRGVSGSGKTTIVQDIVSVAKKNYIVYSSDDADFQNVTKNVRTSLTANIPLVIVDADNEERAMIKKLGEIAISKCYELFVVSTIETSCDISACLSRSTRKLFQDDLASKLMCIIDTPIGFDDFFKDVKKCVRISSTQSDQENSPTTPSTSSSSSVSPVKSANDTDELEVEYSFLCKMFPHSDKDIVRQFFRFFGYSETYRILEDLQEQIPMNGVPQEQNAFFMESEDKENENFAESQRNIEKMIRKLKQETSNDELIALALQQSEDENARSGGSMLTAHMTPEQKRNRFLKDLHKKRTRGESTLNEAQKFAVSAHREMMTTKSQDGPANRNKLERFRPANQKKIAEVDRKLADAHRDPWCIDLHYMLVDGAIKLVQEAIDAVKYHLRQDENVPKKINVITGRGNNSKHGSRIKPAVIKYLRNCRISFKSGSQNEGRLEVFARI